MSNDEYSNLIIVYKHIIMWYFAKGFSAGVFKVSVQQCNFASKFL